MGSNLRCVFYWNDHKQKNVYIYIYFNHLHLTLGLDFTLKSFLLPPGIPCQEAEERERWTIPLSVWPGKFPDFEKVEILGPGRASELDRIWICWICWICICTFLKMDPKLSSQKDPKGSFLMAIPRTGREGGRQPWHRDWYNQEEVWTINFLEASKNPGVYHIFSDLTIKMEFIVIYWGMISPCHKPSSHIGATVYPMKILRCNP